MYAYVHTVACNRATERVACVPNCDIKSNNTHNSNNKKRWCNYTMSSAVCHAPAPSMSRQPQPQKHQFINSSIARCIHTYICVCLHALYIIYICVCACACSSSATICNYAPVDAAESAATAAVVNVFTIGACVCMYECVLVVARHMLPRVLSLFMSPSMLCDHMSILALIYT